MSRRGAERDDGDRVSVQADRPTVSPRQAGQILEQEPRTLPQEPQTATAVARREHERTERHARLADLAAAWRRVHPTVPEQQMLGILATLGARDGVDFQREYKIVPGLYADIAFPADRLVIEVFGGVHTHDFFSRSGERAADDERKLQLLASLGWEVLVVKTAEMSQKRWAGAVERVGRFLADGRGKWSPTASKRGGGDGAEP